MKRSIAELRQEADRRREREFRGTVKFKVQQWMAVEVILRALHTTPIEPDTLAYHILVQLSDSDVADLERQRWPRHVIRYGLRQGRHRVDVSVNTGA